VVLLPDCPEEWKDLVARISVEDRVAEVDEETYLYWLEVLPPRWMNGSHFCFAEEEEPFRLFWGRTGNFFCRQLSRDETLLFCSLAGIAPPLI
jgi:hypothetical protein